MKNQTESIRPFGLFSATCLVVANMIGAGLFTTSGFSFADLGSRKYVMFAWAIGGCVAICGAISYGQLARRVTESGGEYLFLSRMVHPSVGFVAGWVSLLAGFTGAIAFAATAFEAYAIPESIRPDWYVQGFAAATSIVLFGFLHSVVLRSGLVTQNIVVALKLILIVGFMVFAFLKYPSNWPGTKIESDPVEFSIFALASTLVWISLSFSGFNAAVYVTGEVVEPRKNVPRALLLGTILVTAIYLVLNFVFLYGPDPELIRGKPDVAISASQSIGGNSLSIIVRIIVSVSLLSSVSSMVVAGPRVYAKMADDGIFPKGLKPIKSKQFDIPASSIWLQVLLAVIVVWFTTLSSLLDYLGFTLSVSAALTVACLFWSREPSNSNRSHLIYSFIAMLYVATTLLLAAFSAYGRPQQLVVFVATVASGLLLYALVRYFKSSSNK